MGLCWKSKEANLDKVRDQIKKRLSNAEIPSFVEISWKDNELCIGISQGGKSEFRLALSESSNGVTIEESKRDVAFLHRAFVGTVEKMVDKIITEAGFVKS